MRRTKRAAVRAISRKVRSKEITEKLLKIGVELGNDIYVTSSLSSFGNLEHGVDTLFEGLASVAGSAGTILAPGHSNPSTLDARGIDLRCHNMNTGVFPSHLMSQPGSRRSSHPFASTICLGPKSTYYASGHENFPTICHENSPVAKVYYNDAYLIGFGTEPTAMIHYHLIEEARSDYPLNVYDQGLRIEYVDFQGNKINREIKRFQSPLNEYRIERPRGKKIRKDFLNIMGQSQNFHECKIGRCKAWAIKSKNLYSIIEEWLDEGRTIYDLKGFSDNEKNTIPVTRPF